MLMLLGGICGGLRRVRGMAAMVAPARCCRVRGIRRDHYN